MTYKTLGWLLLLLAAVGRQANADDASAGVPLPGLKSQPAGSVTVSSSSVALSGLSVVTDLAVRSDERAKQLRLTGPKFGWLGESEPYPDRQFPELKISSGGLPANLHSGFEGSVGSKDVTALIQAAHLDPWAITQSPPVVSVEAADTAALQGVGALEHSDVGYLAKWSARRILRIDVKPSSVERLSISYTARPAYSLIKRSQLFTPARAATYCLSEKQATGLPQFPAAGTLIVIKEFRLPTGIDANAPASVALTLGAPPQAAPPVFAFACGADGESIGIAANSSGHANVADPAANLRLLTVEEASAKPN